MLSVNNGMEGGKETLIAGDILELSSWKITKKFLERI